MKRIAIVTLLALTLALISAAPALAWPDVPPPIPPEPRAWAWGYEQGRVTLDTVVRFGGNPEDLISWFDEGWRVENVWTSSNGTVRAQLRYQPRLDPGAVLFLPSAAIQTTIYGWRSWPCCHEASSWDRWWGRCNLCN